MSYSQFPPQGFPGGQGFPGQPPHYGYPLPPPPPPRTGRSPWVWALAIAGGVLLLVGGCCVGGYFLMTFGMDVVGEQVVKQIRDDPAVREHIGEIQECEWNMTASAAEGGEDTLVFDLRGSKGSGRLTVETTDSGDEVEVLLATLRLSDGREIELTPSP